MPEAESRGVDGSRVEADLVHWVIFEFGKSAAQVLVSMVSVRGHICLLVMEVYKYWGPLPAAQASGVAAVVNHEGYPSGMHIGLREDSLSRCED